MMVRQSFLVLLALAALPLAGCVSVLPDPAPAPSIYRLAVDKEMADARANAFVIRIDRPAASTYYQGKNIVVSPDGQRLATAGNAQWAEEVPVMIQQSLVSHMSASPNVIGVIPMSGARTDVRAHLTIRQFEANFDQGETSAPLAVVYYDVTLSNASTRNLLGTYSTRKTVRAIEPRVSAIVAAIETANDHAMADIVAWFEGQASQTDS